MGFGFEGGLARVGGAGVEEGEFAGAGPGEEGAGGGEEGGGEEGAGDVEV